MSGGSDWGPGSVGGGPPGASPEYGGALDGEREREHRPEDNPAPRPGCLRALLSIALLVGGLVAPWWVFIFVVGWLS